MNRICIAVLCILSFFISCTNTQKENSTVNDQQLGEASLLISQVMEKTGNYEDLKKLRDVQYTYTLDAKSQEKKNISIERYLFDGELSWAMYLPDIQVPQKKDTIIQAYDGKGIWVKSNSELSLDSTLLEFATFIRPTNFYWFTMMQKLMDPGVQHSLLSPRTVNNVEYQIVEMTFDNNIGSVQDRYLLYVNPETKLIDRFLFTVKARNLAPIDPLLMEVKYKEVDGILLMADRTVKRSTWEGKDDGPLVYHQFYKNIKFNNGFERSMWKNEGE